MKELFDNYLETSFDGCRQADFKFRHFEHNYGRHFPAAGSQTLDIGIGRGEMLACMKNWGMDYHGIDISPSTVKFCQSLALNCELVQDTAAWLSDRPARFHAITALDVIEHVPGEGLLTMLKAINHSLVEGGIAIAQVPNLQSPAGYLHHFNDITHVHGFVEHSLAQVLIAAGFHHFSFAGFEEIVDCGLKKSLHKALRWAYWRMTRALRAINGNPNPRILHPVLFAVARKGK